LRKFAKAETGEAFEEEGRSSSSLLLSIHRSAWKGNSANFAFWGFSEVRFKEILGS
jgi:hypothetical protein